MFHADIWTEGDRVRQEVWRSNSLILQFRPGSKNWSKYLCLTTAHIHFSAAIYLQNHHVQNYPHCTGLFSCVWWWMRNKHWKKIICAEKGRRTPYFYAVYCTTTVTPTAIIMKPGLCGEKLATNCLICCTSFMVPTWISGFLETNLQ